MEPITVIAHKSINLINWIHMYVWVCCTQPGNISTSLYHRNMEFKQTKQRNCRCKSILINCIFRLLVHHNQRFQNRNIQYITDIVWPTNSRIAIAIQTATTKCTVLWRTQSEWSCLDVPHFVTLFLFYFYWRFEISAKQYPIHLSV